ncbi:Plasmodium yoelii subtelomeric region (PYST-C1), putative [Plasmodium chabaudi adami]|uniref:Plasmodium yoelii subtelomeric region (PYST-C1), putative n=1 Tax=Plasmodium chabaudi adami TaxID=5826 RepID=A0A1C6WNL5_PLACE|nr:Plasmodium yoelii subtelomeric region (PYST-C1), putative [Plasmodium chabaudi adami]
MNKRIFSLVCIVLYIFLGASIHCSEQKESGLRSKINRVIKQIKRSNKKNGIEFKRETQLNNNNNNSPKNEDKKIKNRKLVIYYDEKTNIWGYGCCGLWYLFN